MFHLIPYEPEHYLQALGVVANPYDARLYHERGPAWTGYKDDVLLGCGGVALLFPGMGEAWAVFTDEGRRHPTWMMRVIARGLLKAVRTEGLRRVQADTVAADVKAWKLLVKLGFRPESLMRRYGPNGEDFIRFSMFPHPAAAGPLPEGLVERDGVIWVEGYDHAPISGGEPVTIMLAVGAVVAIAATAVSTYAAVQAGESRAAAARYNRKVAINQAQEAKDRAAVQVAQQRQHAQQVMSSNLAQQGASGAEAGYGSSMLLAQENARQGELNAQTAEYTGEIEAINYMRRAQGLAMEGQQAQTAGYLTAGSTALSGTSSILRTYGGGTGGGGGGYQGGASNLLY